MPHCVTPEHGVSEMDAHLGEGMVRRTGCTIVPVRAILQHPMPMESRAVLRQVVGHVHYDPIAHIRLDQGTGKLSVDEEHGTDDAYFPLVNSLEERLPDSPALQGCGCAPSGHPVPSVMVKL